MPSCGGRGDDRPCRAVSGPVALTVAGSSAEPGRAGQGGSPDGLTLLGAVRRACCRRHTAVSLCIYARLNHWLAPELVSHATLELTPSGWNVPEPAPSRLEAPPGLDMQPLRLWTGLEALLGQNENTSPALSGLEFSPGLNGRARIGYV